MVDRASVHESIAGDLGDGLAVMAYPEEAGVGNATDRRGAELPLCAYHPNGVEPFRFRYDEHAFLRLREHDLVRRHVRLASGHQPGIELHANSAPRRHL